MTVFDPEGPWVWLLYALAGAAFIAWAVPDMLKHGDQLQRDVFRANAGAMAFMYVVTWLFWPVLFGAYIVCVTYGWAAVGVDAVRRKVRR
jgi:hypothetical protein